MGRRLAFVTAILLTCPIGAQAQTEPNYSEIAALAEAALECAAIAEFGYGPEKGARLFRLGYEAAVSYMVARASGLTNDEEVRKVAVRVYLAVRPGQSADFNAGAAWATIQSETYRSLASEYTRGAASLRAVVDPLYRSKNCALIK